MAGRKIRKIRKKWWWQPNGSGHKCLWQQDTRLCTCFAWSHLAREVTRRVWMFTWKVTGPKHISGSKGWPIKYYRYNWWFKNVGTSDDKEEDIPKCNQKPHSFEHDLVVHVVEWCWLWKKKGLSVCCSENKPSDFLRGKGWLIFHHGLKGLWR